MRYELTDEAQAKGLMSGLWPKVIKALQSGKQLSLEIKSATRSCPQNAKFHAMIDEIAQQASHLGAKWDAEDWKRMLVWQFCKDTGLNEGKIVPSLDGTGIVQLGQQTHKFTKEQASEFVEFLLSWGAENGVTFE